MGIKSKDATPELNLDRMEAETMKNKMLKLIEERVAKMRRDYQEGWITREEYIVLKAELIAINGLIEMTGE